MNEARQTSIDGFHAGVSYSSTVNLACVEKFPVAYGEKCPAYEAVGAHGITVFNFTVHYIDVEVHVFSRHCMMLQLC